jgi:hypothetical protein
MPLTPVGIGDLTQRLTPMSGLPARQPTALASQRPGGGLAGPSDDGGLEEFEEFFPSCASSSAVRAFACSSRADCSTTSAASSPFEGGWAADTTP